MATSRKDYTAVAARFAAGLAEADNPAYNNLTFKAGYRKAMDAVADFFAEDNPRFDRERFFAAADPGAVEVLRAMAEDSDDEVSA